MAQVHGGRLVARALRRHGVTHLFTLCGGHIQSIYDGCLDEAIRVVDVRHEQTAGHAADGWARITGRPGVCAVTAGPGVADVVTAVANAHRAGVPLLVLGGAGPRALSHRGSLQDLDHVELMRSVTKLSASVPATDRIAEYIDSAFRIAQAGVPGPVFLELPLDVLLGHGDDADPATAPFPPPRPGADPRAVAAAAALLRDAERPLLVVGGQLRWSTHEAALLRFCARVPLPVYLTGMARGALPAEHPSLLSRSRRAALAQADLVIVAGAPLDFRLDYGRSFAPAAKLVHIDLDGAEPGRNRAVDVAVHGDVGGALAALGDEAKREGGTGWLEALRVIEERAQARVDAEIAASGDPPGPLRVCAEVGRRLGPEDVVIGDGGDFVATAAGVIRVSHPQVWMDPGPLGTLGVGPGFAMAAKLARPGARVVILFGDGAFGLHAMEFEALARQRIAVVAVIGNDAAWTQIRRGQVEMYGEMRAVATGLAPTRYDRVVEALGGSGALVERTSDLGPALDAAFAADRPACVNVRIAPSDFRKGAISV